MRKGEIISLTWSKVDLKNRVIRLKSEDTKSGKPRDVPFSKELAVMFRSLPTRLQNSQKNAHVFQFRGKPIRDFRAALKNACKKAGISYGRKKDNGFTFHDLRHTFTTNMRKAGVAESVIMKITGHSTREMFDRYNAVDSEDTKLAVDRLDDLRTDAPDSELGSM